MNAITNISRKETQVIANLEFDEKYFFTRADINRFFKKNQQVTDFIYGLRKKGRIFKINRTKYYLVPIKARSGGWVEDSFITADEICNGKDYFIGGWAAANYWRLTDQIPFQVDVYTIRRQGKYRLMNTRFVFHRTTKKKISRAVKKEAHGHQFYVLNKEEAKIWLRKRQ